MRSDLAEFWNTRYRAGRTPWESGDAPAGLEGFFLREHLPNPGRMLIPGCGAGFELLLLESMGWEITAIDFSPAAVERASQMRRGASTVVSCADFFEDACGGPYDLVFERAFLCSLPPDRWSAYSARMAQLIRPGGCLAGYFWYGADPDPPPYPLNEAAARDLFQPRFRLVDDVQVSEEQSLAIYAGGERWQVWRRESP